MAQVKAEPGDKRHSFVLRDAFQHDGGITAISITKYNRILMCDYVNKKLVLYNNGGIFLRDLPLEGSPWDIAISPTNIAYVTIPTEKAVLQVDPDRFYICSKTISSDPDINVSCVSSTCVTKNKLGVLIGYHSRGYSGTILPDVSLNSYFERNELTEARTHGMCVKIHHYSYEGYDTQLLCVAGESAIRGLFGKKSFKNLKAPSDICSDDNGHVYVSGQTSHNICRFTCREDFNVLDIPFTSKNDLIDPVALCFNSDYTQFYVVDQFGKRIKIYKVI